MKTCDAKIRPFQGDTEVACEGEDDGHTDHRGTLRDYAYPGSATVIKWLDNDRRSYRGQWPGRCPACSLPEGHAGRHA